MVGPEDREREPRACPDLVLEHHGGRVGFGTGRTGCAPDLERSPRTSIEEVGGALSCTGNRSGPAPGKKSVLLVVTQSIRLTTSSFNPPLFEQVGAVLIEAGEPQGPDAFAQTTFDHGALGRGQQDAHLAFDQFGDTAELPVGETL